MLPEKRKRMTDEDRLAVINHFDKHPTLSQSDLAEWLYKTREIRVSQPAISGTLQKREDVIKRATNNPNAANIRRQSKVSFPLMEVAFRRIYGDKCSAYLATNNSPP